MLKRILLLSLVALLALASWPVASQAQDGGDGDDLTEYERLLLDRFVDAMLLPQTYENYTQTGVVKDLQELNYDLSGQTASISTGTQTAYETDIINSETGRNVRSIVELQFQDVAPGETTVYALSGEIRVVDNQLYVQADYAGEVPETLPAMPDGWVLVEDTANYPAFAELNLEDYLDTTSIFDDRELLAANLSAINIEAQVINGFDVQTISMAFRGEDFIPVFKAMQPADAPANTGTPIFDAIFANLGENTEIVMSVAIDAENNPLIYVINITLESNALDLSLIDPENFTNTDTLVVRLLVQRENTLEDRNSSDIEPITSPLN